MHTLLDLRGNVPSFIHISDGKLHDVHALDMLIPEAGAIYVVDRGYVDFARLHVLHQAGASFVTRAKSNMDAHRVYSAASDRPAGIVCDQTISLDGICTKTDYPELLRRIRFKDPESGKTLVFITGTVQQVEDGVLTGGIWIVGPGGLLSDPPPEEPVAQLMIGNEVITSTGEAGTIILKSNSIIPNLMLQSNNGGFFLDLAQYETPGSLVNTGDIELDAIRDKDKAPVSEENPVGAFGSKLVVNGDLTNIDSVFVDAESEILVDGTFETRVGSNTIISGGRIMTAHGGRILQ